MKIGKLILVWVCGFVMMVMAQVVIAVPIISGSTHFKGVGPASAKSFTISDDPNKVISIDVTFHNDSPNINHDWTDFHLIWDVDQGSTLPTFYSSLFDPAKTETKGTSANLFMSSGKNVGNGSDFTIAFQNFDLGSGGKIKFTAYPTIVPEPSSIALLAFGLAGLFFKRIKAA